MKRILKRSTLILVFTLLFIGGASFFCVELVFNADDWANQPYNAHISGNGGLEQAGAVYDRNGTVLAKTQGTDRVYNENYSVRVGLLHTVGDNSLNISTAVQSKYRSQLTGYSLIWGLNMPQSLRTSHDITLTVDANASAAAYDALSAYGKQGACVVYDYKTGEVISSVSTYSYDPEAPPEINEDNEHEYEGVYLDHVLSSSYTPGSIFKLVTAAAAIENIPDLFERTWYCEGHEDIGGQEVRCVDGEAHGTLDFYGALEHSCNIVFAELAVELGPEKMTAAAEKMGINLSYEIDDVSTAKGHYDVSKATTNELAWSGVGQYNDEVNPMQMAKSSTASTLSQSMPSYTFGSLSVRAKTGTAEVGDEKSPNAWMVGFSTDEDCPLAFACVVEDAGFGSQYARPVAETAMQSAAQALRGY